MRGHQVEHWVNSKRRPDCQDCRACLGSLDTVLPERLLLIRSKGFGLIGHRGACGNGLYECSDGRGWGGEAGRQRRFCKVFIIHVGEMQC